MGQDIPAAPPEAEVIRLARKATGMTAEDAAAASKAHDPAGKGVSATYWRDVERGRGGRRGQQVQTRASDRILAAMARVVGVTPPQLTGAGREDAARVLEEMLRREAPPTRLQDAPRIERTGQAFPYDRDRAARMAPHIAEIEGRLAVWARSAVQLRGDAAIGEIPGGATVFPDRPLDAERWDLLVKTGILPGEPHTLWQLVEDVADLRVRDEDRRGGQAKGGIAAGLMRRLRAIPAG